MEAYKRLAPLSFNKSSFIEVLSPFIKFYNFLGITSINLYDHGKFGTSRLALVSCGVNLLFGCYFVHGTVTSSYEARGFFNLVGFGMLFIFNMAVIMAFLIVMTNLATRSFLQRLLQTFVKFDDLSKPIMSYKHSQQFIVLSSFWIVSNVFLFSISIEVGLRRLADMPVNVYLLIGSVYACELPFTLLFLVAWRLRGLRQALSASEFSQAKFKKFACSLDQIFEIIELISRSFGIQMAMFLMSVLCIGMFTVFLKFEMVMLAIADPLTEILYNIYIKYASYGHLMVVLLCFINGSITRDVSRTKFS